MGLIFQQLIKMKIIPTLESKEVHFMNDREDFVQMDPASLKDFRVLVSLILFCR